MDDRSTLPQVILVDAVRSMETMRDMYSTLSSDVQQIAKGANDSEKRAGVRATFAMIEGTCFALRGAAVHFASAFRVKLTDGERQMAQEITYALNERGQVEEKLVHVPTLHNLRFALVLFAKAINADYEVPVGEEPYEKLRRSQAVRNRITHPRTVDDLRISEQEMEDMARAAQWFDDQIVRLHTVCMSRVIKVFEAITNPVLLEKARRPSGGYDPKALAQAFYDAFGAKEPMTTLTLAAFLEQHSDVVARMKASFPQDGS
jgi:hypothetical protein